MYPITKEVPKPMVPIHGKPFISYLIEALKEARCSEIGVVVGYKKEMIIDFFKKEQIDATFIEQKPCLGTGHAIKVCEDFVGGENFIVVLGDNLYAPQDISAIQKNDKFNYVSGIMHEKPEKFGVLVEENGFLKEIKEKPTSFVGNIINTGLYKFTPEIFDVLNKIKKTAAGEYFITDAINMLAQQKKVKVYALEDYWLDLGCCEDIENVEKFLKKSV
jgi:NDP-sugar pyrophosphorylase family protein